MANSVGSLNAMMSLSTRDWDAGLSKARRSLEKTRAQIVKSMQLSGDTFSAKQGEMYASFGGGGMSGVRAARELSMRRAREGYMGRGTAEQQSWQQSMPKASSSMKDMGSSSTLMVGNLRRIVPTLAVVAGAIEVAKIATTAWRDGVGSVYDEIEKLPFGIGRVATDLREVISLWTGDAEILEAEKKQVEEMNKASETQLRISNELRNSKESLSNIRQSAEREASLSGLEGEELEIMQLKLRTSEDLAKVEKQIADFKKANTSADQHSLVQLQRSGIEAKQAILERAQAERTAIENRARDERSKKSDEDRNTDWERTLKIAGADSEIEQARLRISGHADKAERLAIKSRYEQQISDARRAGETEMADRLAMLRDLSLKELDIKGRRLADVDFSAMAGTGSVERNRDVLESIDRGIRRGVVARAA